uniref:SecY-independent protein translocase component tatC n=1 Tax=Dictyopteris divaricata TaxID=156996 RepID=A0A4Y5T7J1_9PHAE|nr:SecY-independent protein translocase component tatC [Dictyopteris divaricata]QDB64116.1 SecY-independent protein translocase component tatC [Dictyopteris divaricata]
MNKVNTFLYYIQEINYRAFYTLMGVTLIFVIAYRYKQTLIYTLLPKGASHFISTEITEIFVTYLYLCFLTSVLIGVGIIAIQIYLFLRPGLYKFESTRSLILLVAGLTAYTYTYIYVYPVVVQVSWEFFIEFPKNLNSIHLSFEPRINNYLVYIRKIATGIGFMLPSLTLVTLLMSKTRIKLLLNYRKIAYVGVILLSAILTPPDPASQLVFAFPFLIYFESQLIFWITYNRYHKKLVGQPIKTNQQTSNKKKKG